MAGSSATKGILSELAKRVPKNQTKQFKAFLDLNSKYKSKVNKYPEKLPTIDWDYYRTNVRMEAVNLVDAFEKKYEEFNKIFDERHKLDTQKYYDELEKQRAVVQDEVKQYIAESNERIKAYEAEILRLCTMKPYSSMTMEEFITLRPECSTYIPCGGKPLFWPHTPEEQTIGPVGIPKPDDGKGAGGDDNGGGGAGHPFTPSDIKGKTEKFEFNPVETQKPVDVAAAPTPKSVDAEPLAQVETKPPADTKELAKLKIHIDEPASEERKKQLDPCKLEEKIKQKSEAKAMRNEQSGTRKTGAPQTKVKQPPDSKAEPKAEVKADSKAKVEAVAIVHGSSKKTHPCDLVKKQMAAKAADLCKGAPKGPYKDEKRDTCIFFDPCKVKFGAGIKSDVEAVEQAPAKEKAATKTAMKEMPKESGPPKKPHPCDLVKKEVAAKGTEPCKGAPKGPYKDEKSDACIFFDPCKVKFGAGIKSDVEAIRQAAAKDKDAMKTTKKELPKGTKNPSPCDLVAKKMEKSERDPCEGANKEKAVKIEECAGKDKSKPEIKTSSTCQSAPPKEPMKKTQSIEDIKKPKVEANMNDKNSCTMVFAEPPKTDKNPQVDAKKIGDSCSQTPYYNPFRSDKENRKKEEDICEVESEDPDYCGDEERRRDKDYYNPCKDEKEKK